MATSIARKLNFHLLLVFLVLTFFGKSALAITQYACTSWEGMSNPPDWLVEDPQPFIMLRDGDSLYLQNHHNKPITITKFGGHNEIIDLYRRIDDYGATSIFYFKHSSYKPESFVINSEAKSVELVKAAINPNWMIKTNCYKRN